MTDDPQRDRGILKANPKMKADPKADAAAAGGRRQEQTVHDDRCGRARARSGRRRGWYFLHGSGDEAPSRPRRNHGTQQEEKKDEHPPEYLPIEPFTVNLQPENGDQYLQVAFTLQVDGAEQAELIKTNMAKVRSRVLLLLSGKKASEINTVEGKQQLAGEILAVVKEPFAEQATSRKSRTSCSLRSSSSNREAL
jgi:flagellar FliL protein